MSSEEQSMLHASDISIGYRRKKALDKVVASNLSLELQKGKFVCLLGPNGTGKSTLVRTLSGLQPPLQGQVSMDGMKLTELDARSRARLVSLVITDSMPLGIFTVYSLVALGRHPHTNWNGHLSEEDHQKIEWAIRTVDAESLANRQVSELSDGERQKVMVARALAQEAPIMLLDEPTAFLDILRRVELMRSLSDLAHQQDLAILLSTHDLELALRCADELWLLGEDGTLTQGQPESLALSGTIADVFGNQKLDWDTEQGAFHIHREPCVFVSLEGDGAEYVWTKRTLNRLGYGVSNGTQKSTLTIAIQRQGETVHWLVNLRETTIRFESLDELSDWIKKAHAPDDNEA